MTVSPRDADVIQLANFLDRLSQWDVLNMPPGSHDDGPGWQREINVALHALDRLVARVHALEKALGRLASTQTFTTALDLDHAKPEALAAELRARGQFAEEAARAVVLEGAARQEENDGSA